MLWLYLLGLGTIKSPVNVNVLIWPKFLCINFILVLRYATNIEQLKIDFNNEDIKKFRIGLW